MPSEVDRPRFEPAEAAEVLAQFNLNKVTKVHEYERGSSQSPKLLVEADGRAYVLKRRLIPGKSLERAAFALQVHQAAAAAGVPVAAAVGLRHGHQLALHRGESMYEMFQYVRGDRYAQQTEQAEAAGGVLARLHRGLRPLGAPRAARLPTYHDCSLVRRAVPEVAGAVDRLARHSSAKAQSTLGLEELLRRVLRQYEESAGVVTEASPLGEECILHGDFHPGNLLYRGAAVRCMLDFDAARLGPPWQDVANAMLQFASVPRGAADDTAWDATLRHDLLRSVLTGYAREANGELHRPARGVFVSHLMIEASVTESIIPLARRGRLGQYGAVDVLSFVDRRINWLLAHAESIARLVAEVVR